MSSKQLDNCDLASDCSGDHTMSLFGLCCAVFALLAIHGMNKDIVRVARAEGWAEGEGQE